MNGGRKHRVWIAHDVEEPRIRVQTSNHLYSRRMWRRVENDGFARVAVGNELQEIAEDRHPCPQLKFRQVAQRQIRLACSSVRISDTPHGRRRTECKQPEFV